MPSLLRLLVLAAVLSPLTGCGGSSHPAAGTPATVTATSPITSPLPSSSTSTSTIASGAVATSSSSAAQSAGVTTPGSGGAGLGPAAVPSGGTRSGGGGSINARVPALFRLSADGRLSPAQVSLPAFLAVAIQIRSASANPHVMLVQTPRPVRLAVAPHGTSLTTIGGLRAGTYAILIDGARRGALVIGGEPGP